MKRLLSATLVVAAVVGIGCDRANPLGAKTATLLERYYETLAAATLDSWTQYVALMALLQFRTSDQVQEDYQVRISALRARADIAHEVAATMTALEAARQNTAADETARQAGERLGQALRSLPVLPGSNSAPAATSTAGKTIAKALLWRGRTKAERQIAHAANTLAQVFADERDQYESIIRERDNRAKNLLAILVEKGLVSAAPHTQRLGLGVSWKSNSDPAMTTVGLAVAGIALQRATLSMECATRETNTALRLLTMTTTDGDLERSLQRASACMDEYQQHAK